MLKKFLFILLGIVVISFIGLVFFGSTILNKGTTTAINTLGPKVTQTPVSVEAVDLSLLGGKGELRGLLIGNPDGYKSENIFEVSNIEVKISKSSLASDTLIVNKIHIIGPKISYEKNLKGTNIKDLQNNIREFTEKLFSNNNQDSEDDPETNESAKKIIIEDLQIKDGTIYAGVMGVGIEIPLPAITLKNIGANDGPSFTESIDQIFGEILNAIGAGLKNSTEVFKEGGKAALDTTKDKILDRGVSELKKLFDQ